MPNYSNFDIIDFAVDEKPSDIMTAFDDLIGQKVLDAVAQKKIEVAQQMFGSEDQEEVDDQFDDVEDQEELDADDSEEDFEFDDEELEELQIEDEEDENS